MFTAKTTFTKIASETNNPTSGATSPTSEATNPTSETTTSRFGQVVRPLYRSANTEVMHSKAMSTLAKEIVEWGRNGNLDDMREAFRLIDQTDFCIDRVRNHKRIYDTVFLNQCSESVKNWYNVYVNCLKLPRGVEFSYTENEPYSYNKDGNQIDCIRTYMTFRSVRPHFEAKTEAKAESTSETKVEA